MGKERVKFIRTPLKVEQENPAMVVECPRDLVHHHSYGQLSPFFRGLREGKLLFTRCTNQKCPEKSSCLPPRADCPDCNMPMEWMELPKPIIGKIYTYTLVERGGSGLELSTPYWQIDVEIPGLATIPKSYLLYGEPYIGMKVKAGFRTRKSTNTILDLHWVPLKEKNK